MFRQGVSALIVNDKDEFLVVNLKSFEDKYFAIPGGGIEEGETLEEAVYREIEEELGIKADNLELLSKSEQPLRYHFITPKIKNDVEFHGSDRYFFAFKFIGNEEDVKNNIDEVSFYKWVSFDELDEHLLFDNQLEETTGKIVELLPNYETKRKI